MLAGQVLLLKRNQSGWEENQARLRETQETVLEEIQRLPLLFLSHSFVSHGSCCLRDTQTVTVTGSCLGSRGFGAMRSESLSQRGDDATHSYMLMASFCSKEARQGAMTTGQSVCYQTVLQASANQGSVPEAKAVLYRLASNP